MHHETTQDKLSQSGQAVAITQTAAPCFPKTFTNRILIVDDTPGNIALLLRMLRTQGYDLHTATDGSEALDLVSTIQPDLILLDVMMPGMDGFEVSQHLKDDDTSRHIPILFISALDDTKAIVKALRSGGNDYITKPFNLDEILARVENQLTMARQRKEIEALREQDRRHFEAINQMKTEFVQMATHDLKNPINVMLGYTYILKTAVSVDPKHEHLFRDALDNMDRSVDKMRSLVTDMLDLMQMQTGMDLRLELTMLDSLAETTLAGFTLMAQQKNIDLTFNSVVQNVEILIDAKKMERALGNLVSNAIKYTPDGGCVTVTVAVEEDHAIIEIADTGLGIPADDLPRLFDSFFRVHTADRKHIEGTGLGLSVVKAVMEQHGGTIQVESELGHGTVFRLMLPRS